MKRLLLILLCLAAVATARPSLQLDRDRVESGKTFGLQLVYPLAELPENRSDLQMEPANGFTLVGIDSTDKVIRPSMEDMFNSFFWRRKPWRIQGPNLYVQVESSQKDRTNQRRTNFHDPRRAKTQPYRRHPYRCTAGL